MCQIMYAVNKHTSHKKVSFFENSENIQKKGSGQYCAMSDNIKVSLFEGNSALKRKQAVGNRCIDCKLSTTGNEKTVSGVIVDS